MHTQNIDYAAIKARLKSLQPKNRTETRYAQLAQLREELLNARKRGVSINTLSAELKSRRHYDQLWCTGKVSLQPPK